MKPNYRLILEDCVEAGVKLGWRRAHKHVENPSEDEVQFEIENCIMGQIYEYFTFDDEVKE